MSKSSIVTNLNPWRAKREQRRMRLAELRKRDGDNCRRCKRPLRFDLPDGHDQGARIEQIVSGSTVGREALENLCLTHGRCNASGADHTGEVTERMRRKNEAALLSRPRKRAGTKG